MDKPYLIRGDQYLARYPNFKLEGRDEDLKRLFSILLRGNANSVILVGPGGVGVSSLSLGLEAAKSLPGTPFDIISKRLFWLDTDQLFASGNGDEIRTSFQKMMDILYRTPDSILIVKDTKDFIESCRNHGTMHFINSLTLAVKSDKTQIIFEVRDEDVPVVFGCHSMMSEGYTLMDLAEPSGESLRTIVQSAADKLSAFHRIKIAPDAVQAAIDLTNKYRAKDPGLSRAQPERSITLLDRSFSRYRMSAHEKPCGLDDLVAQHLKASGDEKSRLSREIQKLEESWTATQAKLRKHYDDQREAEITILDLEDHIAELSRAETASLEAADKKGSVFADFMAAHSGHESPEIREIKKQIDELRRIAAENRQAFTALTSGIDSYLLLTKDFVYTEFSRITGIPTAKLGENERAKLARLENDLKGHVFGQDATVKHIADAVKVARLRKNKTAPLAVMLFGPSGVGKTQLAKSLAYLLNDDEGSLLRINMADYMEKHAVAKLIGAPPGYDGFEFGGVLTNAVRKNGRLVILFDEVEKAHLTVFDVLLSILSDGSQNDNLGRPVDFRETIIILTSNIGQEHFVNEALSFDEAMDKTMTNIEGTFRPEFLNRFEGRQNILGMSRLDLSTIQRIVKREIVLLDTDYSEQGVATRISDESIGFFCADHYNPIIGARGLPGVVKTKIAPVIVDRLLREVANQGTLYVGYDREKRDFTFEFTEAA